MIPLPSRAPARLRPLALASVGAAAGLALVAGGLISAPAPAHAAAASEEVSIERVIDGDTVDVRTGDLVTRVRLLNIDAPELKGADGQPECLAVEATNVLAAMLPVGSIVNLHYDVAKTDRYGRTLAAVTDATGRFVEADLARQGLAARAYFGDNKRFLRAIDDAQNEARSAGVGMWDPAIDCSPEALTRALEQLGGETSSKLPKTTTKLASTILAASALADAAETANASLGEMSWLKSSTKQIFADRIMKVAMKAGKLTDAAVGAIGAAHKTDKRAAAKAEKKATDASKPKSEAKKQAAKKQAAADRASRQKAGADLVKARARAKAAAAAREAARIAAEQEAARLAAEEAARIAAEEAARQAAAEAAAAAERAAAERSQQPSGSSSGGSAGDGGGSTYTGCRNYNGYGMIDTKGRHFEPIPCP